MPRLAKHEKEQCCAFDSKDHRRCRLVREPEKLTCKIHKTYYDRWHEKHPPFADWLLSKRIEEEYRFQFKNGYVQFDSFPSLLLITINRNIYTKMIRILLETTPFSLKDYPHCISTLVSNEFGSRIAFPFETHLAKITELMYIFKDSETLRLFLEQLTLYMVNYAFTSTQHAHIALTYATIVNSHLPWINLLYADSISQIIPTVIHRFHTDYALNQDQKDFIAQFTEMYLEPTLLNFHHSHRHLIRHKCDQFKEELIANVCHPRRIEKLIETYGIEIMDDI